MELEGLEEEVVRLRHECDHKDGMIRQLQAMLAWNQEEALVWTNHSSTPWLGASEPLRHSPADVRFHQ